ncbi:MAG: DUF1549 and DUF1553 domain-containing protein [Verrucomicrobia bacterium]|nr:DUF1549 and DUF1553 domain-containing protein [Verrucomicrobiota bacterium]
MWLTTLVALATVGMSASTAAGVPPSDPVAGRSHWAFQPFADLSGAPVADGSQSRIDDLIVARLEQEGLKWVPDAGRRDLIRRIYFQLVGLPPTAAQTQAFVENKRPEALENIVNQLLNSPQFGERWGRHWLDLARYADSNGLDENFLFREAWRYRNWVIDAVNANAPFDRFVLEQIAGDVLPFDSIEQRDRQRIAAGFMVLGPKVLLGNDANNQRMEVADEQIDTIGHSLLGLTLGCARCHDHKFEPIPTADYYALAGILTSTQIMEQRYMLGEQRVMERLVGLGSEGDLLDTEYERYWRELPQARTNAERAKSALELLKKDDHEGLKELLEKYPESVSEGARDATLASEERIAAQGKLVAELDAAIANAPKIPPRAMIPSDVDTPADESIRLAGKFDQLGEEVPRGFLQVITPNNEIKIQDGKSGRLELGQWLTDAEHGAGRLTARVLANRVWHHLIGVGIVRTVDNFGRTGELPSHPELLDHLASQLIASGWSMKALIREIVLSRTFALSSEYNEAAHAFDPDNRLLWRAHRRRLDPEALRDAILMAAGQLDLTPMASSVSYLGDQATAVGKNEVRRRTDFPNRSVYLPVIRNDLPELFEVFNFADPHATTGARPNTTAATQGLLNDEMVMNAAEATAKQLLADTTTGGNELRIDRMFEQILGLRPDDAERSELLGFVWKTESRLTEEGNDDATLRAWAAACHALLSTSRFQFVE